MDKFAMKEQAYDKLREYISRHSDKGDMIGPEYRRYRIEPGDGTRYEFYIVWLDTAGPEYVKRVVSGVSGGGYVTIGIRDEGSYEFAMDSFHDIHNGFLSYARNKLPESDAWDVVAIMLAASVLVYDPNNIDDAAEVMLDAGNWMERLYGRGER